MTQREIDAIMALKSQGYKATAIARMLNLLPSVVRGTLRIQYNRDRGIYPKSKMTDLDRARRLMLKAGYDPDVVEANFGPALGRG